MAGFNTISLKLKEMYQMITLGGDAELELVDTLDPFSEVGSQATAWTQKGFNSSHLSTVPIWSVSPISLKQKEMCQKITRGGGAELELVDTLDLFSEMSRGGSSRLLPFDAPGWPVVLAGLTRL